GIKSRPVVDVDKVQSDRGVADARLAGTGLAKVDFLPDQNFGPTGFVKADGVRHGFTPRAEMTGAKTLRRNRSARRLSRICAAEAPRNPSRRHPCRVPIQCARRMCGRIVPINEIAEGG